MNSRYRLPLEQYAGHVPTPIAVYRPAGIFGAMQTAGIPFAAIAMLVGVQHFAMAMTDLDHFRSVEDYATYDATVVARIRELDGKHAGQPFPEAERSEWADLNDIHKEVGERVTELKARLARVDALGKDEKHVERSEQPLRAGSSVPSRHVPEDIFDLPQYRSLNSRSQEDELQALIDGALMAIDKTTFPHERADQDATRADMHRLFTRVDDPGKLARHILATGHPVYQKAVIKGATFQSLDAAEERMLQGNVRAQTLTSDTAGGFAVPFQLDPSLMLTSDGQTNPIRQIARVERITGKKWQGITSAGVSAQYTGTEGDEAPATQLALAQPEVETIEASAFVEFSIALELSWGALQSELAMAIQDAKDRLEADKFINGNGAGEPNGLVTTLSPSSNVFVGGTFEVNDLYNLTGSGTNPLPPRFRPRASWLADLGIYNRIRGFSVGNIGEGSIWVRGIADGRPDTLLGKPAYEASAMDNSLADGNDIAVFGDFKYFLVADRIGLTIEVVPHTFGTNRRPKTSRGALAYWMNNTLVLSSNAFRKLRTGTGS